jgi:hypothetical protein
MSGRHQIDIVAPFSLEPQQLLRQFLHRKRPAFLLMGDLVVLAEHAL